MKKFILGFFFVLIFVLAFVKVGHADSGSGKFRLALAPEVSTLGLGGDVILQIVPQINLRMGVNVFDYDYSTVDNEIKYNINLGLYSFSGLLDWHPFRRSFRLSGGLLFINQKELSMQMAFATPQYVSINQNDVLVDVGTFFRGNIGFNGNGLVPYAGIGWGNAVRKGRLGIIIDLGIVFLNPPNNLNLTLDGIVATDTASQEEIAKIKQEILNISSWYYPVINIGISYRFL